uniref:Uncharacterized protein n=1 Tax=Romanomermis culicivorax TaxID=13658 RepID=A0A915HQS2_ROMCU
MVSRYSKVLCKPSKISPTAGAKAAGTEKAGAEMTHCRTGLRTGGCGDTEMTQAPKHAFHICLSLEGMTNGRNLHADADGGYGLIGGCGYGWRMRNPLFFTDILVQSADAKSAVSKSKRRICLADGGYFFPNFSADLLEPETFLVAQPNFAR